MRFEPVISEADRATLAERRATLRAIALELAETLEALPPPETYIEATRAARAVMVCDHSFARLPPEDEAETPDPLRERLRCVADQLLDGLPNLPKPASFEDGQRAARTLRVMDRLFTQLYHPPKALQPAADAADEDTEYRKETNLEQIDRVSFRFAFEYGVWPDGTRIDPDDPDAYAEAERQAIDRFLPVDRHTLATHGTEENRGMKFCAYLLMARINAVTRQKAALEGKWFDGSVYAETDADFYDIAMAFDYDKDSGQDKPVPEGFREVRGDPSLAWWLIHRVYDP